MQRGREHAAKPLRHFGEHNLEWTFMRGINERVRAHDKCMRRITGLASDRKFQSHLTILSRDEARQRCFKLQRKQVAGVIFSTDNAAFDKLL